jgi:transposase
MAKYKRYDYSQRVLIPVSLEDQLMPGTLEFAIHTLVEGRMDLSVFDNRYHNDETGRWAYDPKVLLKIVLVGYSRGLISSRKIERACRENVTFMALSCGQYPDHSTIAAFVSSMHDEILSLFRDVLLVCDETGLLGGTFFALDGCKLPSNASAECSGTISDLKKKRKKIEDKVSQLLAQQIETDKADDDTTRLSEEQRRKRQIDRLQKNAQRIEQWLKQNDPKIGRTGREIKSNVTDNESAMMTTPHGTIQGYNGQALVDGKHQVIVHGEAFGSNHDYGHFAPMVDGAKDNLQSIGHERDCFSGKVLAADSNYHCTSNLEKCDQEGIDAYIPDIRFRTRDSRFAARRGDRLKKARRFLPEQFQYNKSQDHYVCPRGKILRLSVKSTVSKGVIYRHYASDEKDCKACPVRSKCISTSKGAKRRKLTIAIGAEPSNLSWKMAQKVSSEKGRKIYPRRLAIVEPVFANIRVQKRLDRFTLRGKIKVNIQWLLYCIVHNIEKITSYAFA